MHQTPEVWRVWLTLRLHYQTTDICSPIQMQNQKPAGSGQVGVTVEEAELAAIACQV